MDSFREHPSDFDLPSAGEIAASQDVAAAIGTDERRMHVRAYNYWVALLEGRDFPSIEDLEPGNLEDFSSHSVLLDFTCGGDNPAIPYIGAAIRDECALSDDMRTIADVPSRSLLSRLTDHYMQIIANRAPVGLRGRVRQPARRCHLLSRHPHAFFVGRRHDRLHLRRDQLEARRRGVRRAACDRRSRAGTAGRGGEPLPRMKTCLELTDAVVAEDAETDAPAPIAEPAYMPEDVEAGNSVGR